MKVIVDRFKLPWVGYCLLGIMLMTLVIEGSSIGGDTKTIKLREYKIEEIKKFLNTSVDPCDDFYEYVCGNFAVNSSSSTMPAILEMTTWYTEMLSKEFKEDNGDGDQDNPVDKLLKDFYRSCVNLPETLENNCKKTQERVLKQLKNWPLLADGKNDTWQESQFDWVKEIAEFFHNSGIDIILGVDIVRDFTNNTINHVAIFESGFLYPYPHGLENIEKYRNNMVNEKINYLKKFLAVKEETKLREAVNEIINFEFALAQGKINAQKGLPKHEIYNLTSIEDMQKKYSQDFNVSQYLHIALGFVPSVIMVDHRYLENALRTIRNTPKKVVANYVIFTYLETLSMDMPITMDDIVQDCLSIIQEKFHKELDNRFYRKYIRSTMEKDVKFLWQQIRGAFKEALLSNSLNWLAESTRSEALQKLETMKISILTFESINFTQMYSNVHLDPLNYMENKLTLQALRANEIRSQVNQPPQIDVTDGSAISHVPSYSATENTVRIPVSLLYLYHIYGPSYPKAINFGTMGAFMGHEMIHGFDDSGGVYDAKGNTRNWWQPKCFEEFKERRKCFMEQYHKFTMANGQHLPLMPLQSENIADNGGLHIAYEAYTKWFEQELSGNLQLQVSEQLDGLNYTHKQLFFIAYGQSWCTSYSSTVMDTTEDIHMPPKYRVLGTLANSMEFSKVFQCPLNSGMNPSKKCVIY
ncbi:neprilysin-2-like [Haematobia irritans]|uniref:neprilysin-2-like n=1 Tax=Haematobia irritans TaxID=7368 RepID=UPI003F506353